jgi:hypothetical protein
LSRVWLWGCMRASVMGAKAAQGDIRLARIILIGQPEGKLKMCFLHRFTKQLSRCQL